MSIVDKMGLAKLQKIDTSDQYWVDLLSNIVSKVEHLCPLAVIYVFGSFAKNLFNAESDLDIAVILPDSVNVKDFHLQLRRDGPLSPWPLDLLLIPQSRFNKRKQIGGICMVIDSEGVELYPKWKLTNVSKEK